VTRNRQPRLTPEEARRLHTEALVIDSQQPPITSGIVFTPKMRETVAALAAQGRTRSEAAPAVEAAMVRDIQTSDEAKRIYLDMWSASGVTVACGTYSGSHLPSAAFESAVSQIANAQGIIAACGDQMLLVRDGGDIERAYTEGKHGVVIDFQNTLPLADDLDRLQMFHSLGLRMVQLTYNLQNLAGDGCTDLNNGGLTYFGREIVRRLNDLDILVDVSHCSEQVGWDAMEISTSPVVVSHSTSGALASHDRAKSDELARAVAERGGYFGVVTLPGFLRATPGATVHDVVRHIEHLVDVCGIDHVGIGTDKAGPGPSTGSLVEYPDSMPRLLPGEFDWMGFRNEEHRLTPEFAMDGFNTFRDWPNITVALAEAGFNEEELRKILGLNFLRVFRDVVG
jgi:membrane dipeptidase